MKMKKMRKRKKKRLASPRLMANLDVERVLRRRKPKASAIGNRLGWWSEVHNSKL